MEGWAGGCVREEVRAAHAVRMQRSPSRKSIVGVGNSQGKGLRWDGRDQGGGEGKMW